jgi:hypothetical protein
MHISPPRRQGRRFSNTAEIGQDELNPAICGGSCPSGVRIAAAAPEGAAEPAAGGTLMDSSGIDLLVCPIPSLVMSAG